MEKKPLVSVVVTAYNSKPFLQDCLNSIYTQTYDNWEIIFVDDCSTDDTIGEFKKIVIQNEIFNKVRMYRHPENYGYGTSLYHSIEMSNGEIIAIVDSDDVLAVANAFDIMIKEHIKNPDASLIYSNYNEAKNDLGVFRKVQCTTLKPGQSVLGRFIGGKYGGNNIVISHLKTFKKSFYEKTEGVDPYLKKAVDRDIVLKLEEVGKLLHIPEYLYTHRIHTKSISNIYHSKSKMEREEIDRQKHEMYWKAYKRRQNISQK